MNEPPFALFVIAEDINVDDINDHLTRAWKGEEEASWKMWLVTSTNYDDAPRTPPDGSPPAEGTQAPVSDDTSSPWIGKTLEDCALWLQAASDDVAFNKEYFAAMDQYSKEDDTMLVCRVLPAGTNRSSSTTTRIQFYPVETRYAQMDIFVSIGLVFDEHLQMYQRQRAVRGKPDRSQGVPYEKRKES